mgnify:FL=1
MSSYNVVLLLGSNIGNTEQNLQNAIAKIENRIGNINKLSKMLETKPVEFVSNNIFRNIAVSLYTNVSPFYLLREIKNIEKEMGRAQDSFAVGGYIDRIIDIDIVLYGDVIIQSKILEIPHKKHLLERDFSKILLEEIK